MDYPTRLYDDLQNVAVHDSNANLTQILQWNSDVESFLAGPTAESLTKQDDNGKPTPDILLNLSLMLHKGIVSAILQREIEEDDLLEREANNAVETLSLQNDTMRLSETCFELIRATKNFLRWYIQIFLQENRKALLPSPVATLQSSSLLKLFLAILEHQTLQEPEISNHELSRNICLYLFYATYILFPGDETPQKALHHLIVELGFPELALRMLTRSSSAALALAIVRNLHNAIITLQGASKIILDTHQDWDPALVPFPDPAPWLPSQAKKIDLVSTCVEVLLWALNSDPPFPGTDDDKRSELASEILGALYALRVGRQLSSSQIDNEIMELLVTTLQLQNIADDRVKQCKLSTITLLMDSDGSFGTSLMQRNVLPDILHLLEVQVTTTLDKTGIDNSAIAGLVPILVLLNKYATADSSIRSLIKLFVFPIEAEETFQKKVKEQQLQESSSTSKQTKKNMGPLDAPAGTFRRKLCTLLTWPEGRIKRCTGELLWTLCSSNPTEFVHRVGFGNALPILAARGLATMPTGTSGLMSS